MEPHPELLGMDLEELARVAESAGLPKFGARQLADWLYHKHALTFDAMTNLSKEVRTRLAASFRLGRTPPADCAISRDGTRKYLFPVRDGLAVEAALIPDEDRATLCLSTQIGCRRSCRFCATGRQGFRGNLSAAEILNQYASLPERDDVTNIVFMGMGEPLDNLEATLRAVTLFSAPFAYGMSPSRITVSTVGILPALDRLIRETRAHIALSLHSPFPDERRTLIPAQAKHPAEEVLRQLKAARIRGQRRVMIEYAMLDGINDTRRHAEALLHLLHGLDARVNLIPFNAAPGIPFKSTPRRRIEEFQNYLLDHGRLTHIRKSRGADIAAACGLLANTVPAPVPEETPDA